MMSSHYQIMNKPLKEHIWVQISSYRINKSVRLGKGATGEVYFGLRKDGVNVAVKSISINKVTESIQKQIKNEITNLQALSSPFIVKFYDCFRDKENLYLVLEYCDDGDLKTYLQRNKTNGLSQNQVLIFMRHLMLGYDALSQKSIIHRDIKPANILLKQGVAKLSDFGFSRVVEDPTKTQKLSLLGTPLYTAPEILASQNFNNKCDIWSLGIVFYEMLHGHAPWTGNDIENLKSNILNIAIEFKQNLNPAIKQVLSQMLKIHRQERISWDQLKKAPIFAQPQDLGIEKQKEESGYEQAKAILLNYLKNYLVKSYLLLNTNANVQFAPTEEPQSSQKSQTKIALDKEVARFTKRRNFAFLHMYLLALYLQNRQIMPEKFNYFREFQFGLIGKGFYLISELCQQFMKKGQSNDHNWKIYQKTPQFIQFSQLLQKDYMLLSLLYKTCRNDITEKILAKKLHSDAAEYVKKYEKTFEDVFKKAMEFNFNAINSSTSNKLKGVGPLIADYISNCILNPATIIENTNLNLAFYYEHRERQYGLS